jgi:hypothetical protein
MANNIQVSILEHVFCFSNGIFACRVYLANFWQIGETPFAPIFPSASHEGRKVEQVPKLSK